MLGRPPASALPAPPWEEERALAAPLHHPGRLPDRPLAGWISREAQTDPPVPLEAHLGGRPPGAPLAQLLASPTASSPGWSCGELCQQGSYPASRSPGPRAGRWEGRGWKMVAGVGGATRDSGLGRQLAAWPRGSTCPAQVSRCARQTSRMR